MGPGVAAVIDRIKDSLFALVRAANPTVDYYAFYRATVVSQTGDGRYVDVRPDSPKIPGMSKVPLKLGLPGATAKFSGGAKVLVGWEDGDPRFPVAIMFGGGESVTQLTIVADKVELGGENLLPLLEQVVIGQTTCQFTGAPHHVVGNLSKKVFAKG